MRILITRPRDDARRLADVLAGQGCESLIEPMLSIHLAGGGDLDLDEVQALLLTSANGARALAANTTARAIPVYAVGEATAREARSLGFTTVVPAAGDLGSLASLVARDLVPGDGPLVHIAGSHVAGDLAAELAPRKFTIRREILYEAREAQQLSDACRAALEAGAIDAVLLYSPRTARIFVNLAESAGVGQACRNVTALCLSAAVAEAAASLPWRQTRVAARPEQAALLKLIADLA